MEQLHEHNQKTYENICHMYGEGIQRVAVVQPTGSGKSLLMSKLIEENPDSRFFVLSTSHKINDQFKSKLDEETLKRIDFNIYCNMPNMKQEIMEVLQPDYIFLDEMHRTLAKEWSKGINVLLNMYPDAKVLGLSATPIRYLDKCRNVAEELFGGNLACDMSLSQAILDGILPMARYVCGVYSYEKDTESLNKKIAKSCNSDEEKKELLKELKILKENLDKGHGVSDIFKKYIVSGNEKFVVFLKNTTHLRTMKPVIEKWFLDAGFTVRLYEVHSKNVDKDKEFQAFKDDKGDGIKLCLSVAMLTEGIHGDIDGVIMLRETISANMYFQMIGRAFACGKKTIPLIFDLVANSQFISDATDLSFPNELRGEIEKRKKECEKEDKEYEVGFDVNEFIVMDEFMDAISGFRAIEGRLIGSWDVMFQEYCKFYEENGHGDVLKTREYKKLNNWCKHQRQNFSNGILSDIRIDKLNKKKFIWNIYQFNFDNNFKALKQYKEREGDCLVPYNHIEVVCEKEINLGHWCQNLRASNHVLAHEKREQLEQLDFIWDTEKYKFEKKVREVAAYYKEYGNFPSQHSENFEIKKLGIFLVNIRQNIKKNHFPEWKMILVKKYIPEFSSDHNSVVAFNRFLYYARLYKEKNGHLNIKINDVMSDNYKIGIVYCGLKQQYKKGLLAGNRIKQCEELGIYLGNKFEKQFTAKMKLAEQAVNEGIVINTKNQMYNEVNLYTWIRHTIIKKYKNNDLSNEKRALIEKLTGKLLENSFNNGIFVKIVDMTNKEEIAICRSKTETMGLIRKNYSIKVSEVAIQNRLKGKIITPYKGRFMFYYATDEEVKKYLENSKVS